MSSYFLSSPRPLQFGNGLSLMDGGSTSLILKSKFCVCVFSSLKMTESDRGGPQPHAAAAVLYHEGSKAIKVDLRREQTCFFSGNNVISSAGATTTDWLQPGCWGFLLSTPPITITLCCPKKLPSLCMKVPLRDTYFFSKTLCV